MLARALACGFTMRISTIPCPTHTGAGIGGIGGGAHLVARTSCSSAEQPESRLGFRVLLGSDEREASVVTPRNHVDTDKKVQGQPYARGVLRVWCARRTEPTSWITSYLVLRHPDWPSGRKQDQFMLRTTPTPRPVKNCSYDWRTDFRMGEDHDEVHFIVPVGDRNVVVTIDDSMTGQLDFRMWREKRRPKCLARCNVRFWKPIPITGWKSACGSREIKLG